MAHQPRKSASQRLEMEARRRRHDAVRIAGRKCLSLEERAARVAAEIRALAQAETTRACQVVAERESFTERLEAALAITNEFQWQPWGYERTEPPIPQPLRIIVDNTSPKVPASARARFDPTLRQPNVARILAGAAA